jgi:predicted glycoside hydrolase/deacetylase ChbG (UPF0249 family)
VVLVDGQPMLPPEQIPALVGPDGWFQPDMVKTAFAIAFNPAARAQMRAEVAAQFAAFAATGLRLDHVNAHKHFHMHPMITSAILDAGHRWAFRRCACRSSMAPVSAPPPCAGGRASGPPVEGARYCRE